MSFMEEHHLAGVSMQLIDRDHHNLAHCMEAVRVALTRNEPKRTDAVLDQLRRFALTHYALEESMMIALRYPRVREHIRMHQRLIDALTYLLNRNSRDGAALKKEALQAIEDLHAMHLGTDDAEFRQWLHHEPV